MFKFLKEKLGNVVKAFSKNVEEESEKIEIPQSIIGLCYIEGKAIKKPVFGQVGIYRIILSDNLETAFENSNSSECKIYFIPKSVK